MNINLGAQWEAFITEHIQSGRYVSASEVVRDGLRLLQEREQLHARRLAEVRGAVDEGIAALDNGDSTDVDAEGLKRHLDDVKQRGRQRRAGKRAASE